MRQKNLFSSQRSEPEHYPLRKVDPKKKKKKRKVDPASRTYFYSHVVEILKTQCPEARLQSTAAHSTSVLD